MDGADGPERCELCRRPVPVLTRHHLIPRRLHRQRRFLRLFPLDEMRSRVLWVCRPCHNAIHHACDEQTLGLYYNTRQALLGLPELRAFADWLGTKSAGFTPKHRLKRRR